MSIFSQSLRYSPDDKSALVAAIVLGVIANISFIIQPGLVGGFVETLGFSEAQAGELAAAEMFGIAAAAMIMAASSLKMNWRVAALLFAATACVGNGLSSISAEFNILAAARAGAGFGHGGLISLSFSAIGLSTKTDRNLGYYLVILLTYGALGLLAIPTMLTLIGLSGVFTAFAIISATTLFLLPYLPAGARSAAEMPAAEPIAWTQLFPTLIGFFLYNTAIGAVWAYLFLIGLSFGLDDTAVAGALFFSQIFGIAGAYAAVMISNKTARRFWPLTIGILGGAVCIAVLTPAVGGYWIFLISVCGFNLVWNKVLPFILSAINDFDQRGRIIPFALAIQMFGLAVGPFLASQVVSEESFFVLELLSIAFFVIGYCLIVVPISLFAVAQTQDKP